jgi:uncharacterized protein
MKYLFWLLVILLVWWAYRRAQKPSANATSRQTDTPDTQDMVRCAHCGIHLPRDEAVRGEKGLYCGTEHRLAAQDRTPA